VELLAVQASEMIKIATGISSKLDGGILTFNSFDLVFRVFELS
jgi:hypothetical protein